MKNKVFLLLIVAVLLSASTVQAKRILFYEVGTTSEYTIESGYSKFAEELKNKGYDIASITRGDISKDALQNYDILVIMNVGKSLTTEEISSVIEFVLQRGRAVFINGVEANSNANQITIPFGITVDSGTLIDPTDPIPGVQDRTMFTIDRFNDQIGMSTLRQGITKVGFYKGSGIKLSGSSKAIAQGNSDTYSDTGSFAAGSYPPVAAASIFGSGLVFITSDADFLSNKHIDEYNNKRFGLNIIDWLSLTMDNVREGNTTQELQYVIAEKKLEVARLEVQVKQMSEEKNTLLQQNSILNSQVSDLQTQLDDLQSGMIGPFSKMNWAIIILGVCILLAAFVMSRRKSASAAPMKDDDILNELGYELEDSSSKTRAQKSTSSGAEKDLENELDNIKL